MAAVGLVLLLPAVLAVPQEGVAGSGELGPDLVGAAGDQLTLHQGEPLPHRQGPI